MVFKEVAQLTCLKSGTLLGDQEALPPLAQPLELLLVETDGM